jgi:hypothetical protein
VIGASPARLAAAAILALGIAGVALGCGDDDDEPVAVTTTPTTGATGADESVSAGNDDGTGDDQPADQAPTEGGSAPTDTGTETPPPSSGGSGGSTYDPEQDSPENDVPPPPGSPAEQFEQECEQNPEICE